MLFGGGDAVSAGDGRAVRLMLLAFLFTLLCALAVSAAWSGAETAQPELLAVELLR